MVFVERKKPEKIISWVSIFIFLPVVGFVLYMLVGGGLSIRTRVRIRKMKRYSTEYLKFTELSQKKYKEYYKNRAEFAYAEDIIKYNEIATKSPFLPNNKVDVFTSGPDMLESLKKDLLSAKHSINIEYYIFAKDSTGKQIMDILIDKAKQGVKVNLIYDSVGSLKTPRRFFRKLKKAGGRVAEFFPPLFHIRLINLKINYRNHRKIVVIDGKIAYTGGINLRDDHMGKKKRLSPWRDTHIRVSGYGVVGLQNVFFNDWRYVTKDKTDAKNLVKQGYFLDNYNFGGDVGMQIVTSGPESDNQSIKQAMIKLISSAKKSIYIQTPYFIPDETFYNAIVMAKNSGVDVNIMIPKKPDKKYVYFATLSFLKDLIKQGINVYRYNGFIHSKTLVVDDLATTIGTCNTDNRSFALNFEVNAIMYGKEFCQKNRRIFIRDIKDSTRLTSDYYKRKKFGSSLAQAICRLFSPLM